MLGPAPGDRRRHVQATEPGLLAPRTLVGNCSPQRNASSMTPPPSRWLGDPSSNPVMTGPSRLPLRAASRPTLTALTSPAHARQTSRPLAPINATASPATASHEPIDNFHCFRHADTDRLRGGWPSRNVVMWMPRDIAGEPCDLASFRPCA